MSETPEAVIAAWQPGQKIPTPRFDNWRDIHTFASWLASNERIASDLRAKAAEHVAIAERELAFWTALAEVSRNTDEEYPW